MIPNKPYDLSIFKQETSFHVDSFSLDEFIADVYSMARFEGTLESNNDTTHEYHVVSNPNSWHDDTMKSILVDESCSYYQLRYVLNDMCAMGIIPEGKYYVRVSW
jgi:hypothetical protein